jgi:ubiquitin
LNTYMCKSQALAKNKKIKNKNKKREKKRKKEKGYDTQDEFRKYFE